MQLKLGQAQPRVGQSVKLELVSRYPLPAADRPEVRIRGPEGQTRTLTLTATPDGKRPRFTARFAPDKPGRHRLNVVPPSVTLPAHGNPDNPGTPRDPGEIRPSEDRQRGEAPADQNQPIATAQLLARPRSIELADTSPRPGVLEQFTEATGGRTLPLDRHEALVEHLRSLAAARTASPRTTYAFNRWPALGLIVGCLALEWTLRRRSIP
jgi:hypothetical protein